MSTPGYRSVAQLRADLAEAQTVALRGRFTRALHKACAELAVDCCRDRLRAALRAKAHPYKPPTVEQMLDKLHRAGVTIIVNDRSTA